MKKPMNKRWNTRKNAIEKEEILQEKDREKIEYEKEKKSRSARFHSHEKKIHTKARKMTTELGRERNECQEKDFNKNEEASTRKKKKLKEIKNEPLKTSKETGFNRQLF